MQKPQSQLLTLTAVVLRRALSDALCDARDAHAAHTSRRRAQTTRPAAQVRRAPLRRRITLALALATGLLSPLAGPLSGGLLPLAQAHAAAAPLRYQRGYSVQAGSWLCYGWSNGAYHCTQHWYRTSGGALISTNTMWVPNGLASGAASSSGVAVAYAYSAAPQNVSQWAYTGRGAYSDGWLQGAYPAGNCTLYAWSRDTRLWGLGNAGNWAAAARARGLAVSWAPTVGATAVFAGGVQGASGLGHVAHVEQVYANGWFLVSEMNFFWNGGGWGRVDYRYAHIGSGVSFIVG
jgi:surface antigen